MIDPQPKAGTYRTIEVSCVKDTAQLGSYSLRIVKVDVPVGRTCMVRVTCKCSVETIHLVTLKLLS